MNLQRKNLRWELVWSSPTSCTESAWMVEMTTRAFRETPWLPRARKIWHPHETTQFQNNEKVQNTYFSQNRQQLSEELELKTLKRKKWTKVVNLGRKRTMLRVEKDQQTMLAQPTRHNWASPPISSRKHRRQKEPPSNIELSKNIRKGKRIRSKCPLSVKVWKLTVEKDNNA